MISHIMSYPHAVTYVADAFAFVSFRHYCSGTAEPRNSGAEEEEEEEEEEAEEEEEEEEEEEDEEE